MTLLMKRLSCILLLSLLTWNAFAADESRQLGYIAVQDGGRIKPFETFARESLKLMYGRETFKTAEGLKIPARDVIFTILLAPEIWQKSKLFQVRHSGLREALKFQDQKEIYHDAEELMGNERLPLLIQDLRSKRDTKEKLDPYFQAIATLEQQLSLFQGLRSGAALRVVPQAPNSASPTDKIGPMQQMSQTLWMSVADLDGEYKEAFLNITRAFSAYVSKKMNQEGVPSNMNLEQAVTSWNDLVQKRATERGEPVETQKVKSEVHYNDFHPHQKAWIAYLIAVIFLVSFRVTNKIRWYKVGWVFALVGFLLSTYGMVLRVYLTGRPPVSNMYETVVWVPFTAVLIAFIYEFVTKNRIALMMASMVSVLCLIVADSAPAVLDASLSPLEPVLRDNFWLVTHVLIIVSSYGAFFLAFALGDLALFYYFNEKKNAAKIADAAKTIYRCMQIGVLLLAAGTILGGVWADYSWGRFWGWDPKETWAFIALMGYLAILHGRLTGWLREFGTAVGAVLAFNLVMMSWYGVNFVLGAGLHTYGFGAGGVEYVAAFCALHLLYVAYVVTARQSRMKASKAK